MMLKEKLNEMKANSEGMKLFVIDDVLEFNESDDEITDYINQVLQYGCVSGTVSSLIYCSDTKEFFTKYQDEIFEMLEDFKEECGIPFEINSNNLAWFGYEEILKNIAVELGIW